MTPPITTIAVAICSCSPRQRHIGLVYVDATGTTRLLELCLNGLSSEAWNSKGYLWYVPNLGNSDLIYLQAAAMYVADSNGSYVPFGFSDPRGCFDDRTGQFVEGAKTGLTCASFVLAVFEYARLPLVEYESWQPRSDDIEWQVYVLDYKEKRWRADSDTSARRRLEIGNLRYRPEEVVAAARLFPPPQRFDQVVELSIEIVENLKSAQ